MTETSQATSVQRRSRPRGPGRSPGDAGTASPSGGHPARFYGSPATTSPDSDVDLMAVCPDEDAAREVNRTVRSNSWKGSARAPVRERDCHHPGSEFVRTAPLGQSYRRSGRPARRNPRRQEAGLPAGTGPRRPRKSSREAVSWLTLAEVHLGAFSRTEGTWLAGSHIPALDAQTALERAFKGLLAAGNDPVRFRRDAALMWRHIKGTEPNHGPERRGGGGETCWPPPKGRKGDAA